MAMDIKNAAGALAVGLAVGVGMALLLGSRLRRQEAEPSWQGRAAEGGETTSYEDAVDQASDESFPASDPPSYSGARHIGQPRGRRN